MVSGFIPDSITHVRYLFRSRSCGLPSEEKVPHLLLAAWASYQTTQATLVLSSYKMPFLFVYKCAASVVKNTTTKRNKHEPRFKIDFRQVCKHSLAFLRVLSINWNTLFWAQRKGRRRKVSYSFNCEDKNIHETLILTIDQFRFIYTVLHCMYCTVKVLYKCPSICQYGPFSMCCCPSVDPCKWYSAGNPTLVFLFENGMKDKTWCSSKLWLQFFHCLHLNVSVRKTD